MFSSTFLCILLLLLHQIEHFDHSQIHARCFFGNTFILPNKSTQIHKIAKKKRNGSHPIANCVLCIMEIHIYMNTLINNNVEFWISYFGYSDYIQLHKLDCIFIYSRQKHGIFYSYRICVFCDCRNNCYFQHFSYYAVRNIICNHMMFDEQNRSGRYTIP